MYDLKTSTSDFLLLTHSELGLEAGTMTENSKNDPKAPKMTQSDPIRRSPILRWMEAKVWIRPMYVYTYIHT
jgi:hypothetical protein